MKILKPGKVEMRKFVCPKCGCVFVTSTADIRTEGGCDGVSCPEHGCAYFMVITRGEPYEEPTQDEQTDALRLYELMKEAWPYSIGALNELPAGALNELSAFLAANGVTFKEE